LWTAAAPCTLVAGSDPSDEASPEAVFVRIAPTEIRLSQALPLPPARGDRRDLILLVALLVGAALVRAWLAAGSTVSNMDPDAAHFLNVARMFRTGHGFTNPAAWPAWIQPASLPMPETFKEPGYPWLIAQLGGTFAAGQALSLVAGILLPWATFALARRRGVGVRTALFAALLVAASPLALLQSVRVMVDALFALVVTTMFVAASRDLSHEGAARPAWRDLASGALFGASYLLRAQTVLLLLPLAVLLFEGRRPAAALRALGVALLAAAAVSAPFWLRNLRLFHTPFYSDIAPYGLWPYVDHLAFSHGLEHPPAVLPFVLGHVPQVLAHMARSAVEFFGHALPVEVIGHPLWMLPLAAGLAIAVRAPGTWAFAFLYAGTTLVFIMAVHWDARYFTSSVPLWCLLTAVGAAGLARAIVAGGPYGPVPGAFLLAAATVVALAGQVRAARNIQRALVHPELAAARREAPFLDARLAPDEAVLAVTTSYWSYFAERPSVHLVLADEARFDAVMRRLKVKWAALPTSRLPEFAARYPGGALPRSLVFDHADSTTDVTIFRVNP